MEKKISPFKPEKPDAGECAQCGSAENLSPEHPVYNPTLACEACVEARIDREAGNEEYF